MIRAEDVSGGVTAGQVTLGRTRASVWRTPCPGALCATRAWTRGMPYRTPVLPPGHPGYATQKATPLLERAAAGPLRNPSQHSRSPGRHDPSLAPGPDPGGPFETRRRGDSDGRGRGSGAVKLALTTIGPGRKPERGPGPRMERGGAGVARWEAGAHIRARSGVPKGFPALTHRDGPRPAGIGLQHPVRSERADACSPGEVRAVRCPVAGRARKGVG